MSRVTRTITVPSIVLTKKKFDILRELGKMYKLIVTELVEFEFKHDIKSFTGLKKHKYRELRSRYPHLPSHYIPCSVSRCFYKDREFSKTQKVEQR